MGLKSKFKKTAIISVFVGSILMLSACSTPKLETKKKVPNNYDPNAMSGMPCHAMGGQYMGDCEFDDDGNVILDESSHGGNQMNGSGETFSSDISGLAEAKSSKIVELNDGDTYEMVASIVRQEVGNRTIKRLAYNGQIPGPLLKVDQNSKIKVVFKNELDVDTTVHSHGLRLDNEFDGVPGVTQNPVKPGESFSYELKFPDEGIYWYHPHIREDYTQELGLYGSMLVEPADKNYWAPVDREENLIVDDILINGNQPKFSTTQTDHSLMGRFGNVMLLNNEENFQLQAKKGEVVRFYLTNVANTRTFNFGIDGVKTKLVGGDVGRIEKETLKDSFVIAPAERIIFEAEFNEDGVFDITHKTPEKTYQLGQVKVSGEINSVAVFDKARSNEGDYSNIRSDIDNLTRKAPDKSLKLSIDMMGMGMSMMGDGMIEGGMMQGGMMGQHVARGIEWEDEMPQMNPSSNSETVTWKLIDTETGKENMDIGWAFKKGDLVKIRIFNDPKSMHPMQHPIHFHGQRFLVLSRDQKVNDNFQWKDTALIKTGETVDILVEMSNPGTWMSHCHIAEHLHSGMMMSFEVK